MIARTWRSRVQACRRDGPDRCITARNGVHHPVDRSRSAARHAGIELQLCRTCDPGGSRADRDDDRRRIAVGNCIGL